MSTSTQTVWLSAGPVLTLTLFTTLATGACGVTTRATPPQTPPSSTGPAGTSAPTPVSHPDSDDTAETHANPHSLLWGDGMPAALAKFEAKLGGPVKALELSVYDEYAILEAQDPKNAENVDEYWYRNGEVSGPEPVKLSGGGKLEDNLFSLADVNFSSMPEVSKAALARTNIEGGELTSMSIKRNLPFSPNIVWRVFVNGTRKDASLELDAAGNIKTVRVD